MENENINQFYAKYDAKETIGTGISSIVRKCVNKFTGEEYAVKIIDRTDEKEYMVKSEITVLSLIRDHPNIIQLVDYFETGHNYFLVLDLAQGGELFDYLTKNVFLPEKECRVIIYRVLLAIAHMHRNSIVHRDIKPENILLGKNGIYDIKVSDFGFATQIKNGDRKLTEVCGTMEYMAPEVLRCGLDEVVEGYDQLVDLWSVGVILYMLLVGFSPFWSRKQTNMLWKIIDGKYDLSSYEWMSISNAPKDLISKLLVVDASKRLTAEQALLHPWFEDGLNTASDLTNVKVLPAPNQINKRRKFRLKIVVIAITCLKYSYESIIERSRPILLEKLIENPYSGRAVRRILDSCAFQIYNHWIQRSTAQYQNRAALFQIAPKRDVSEERCLNVNFQYRFKKEKFVL